MLKAYGHVDVASGKEFWYSSLTPNASFAMEVVRTNEEVQICSIALTILCLLFCISGQNKLILRIEAHTQQDSDILQESIIIILQACDNLESRLPHFSCNLESRSAMRISSQLGW